MPSAYALKVHRRNTLSFIAENPTTVTLTPITREVQPNRSYREVAGTPRDPQVGRLIPLAGTGGTIVVEGDDGTKRSVDYQLLLPHDAIVAKGDRFTVGGDELLVIDLEPGNGYEVRAQVARWLPRPVTVVA